MVESLSGGLPEVLRWPPKPGNGGDPVPEWWLSKVDPGLQAELIGLRLQTLEQVCRIQAEAMGRAAELVRRRQG